MDLPGRRTALRRRSLPHIPAPGPAARQPASGARGAFGPQGDAFSQRPRPAPPASPRTSAACPRPRSPAWFGSRRRRGPPRAVGARSQKPWKFPVPRLKFPVPRVRKFPVIGRRPCRSDHGAPCAGTVCRGGCGGPLFRAAVEQGKTGGGGRLPSPSGEDASGFGAAEGGAGEASHAPRGPTARASCVGRRLSGCVAAGRRRSPPLPREREGCGRGYPAPNTSA